MKAAYRLLAERQITDPPKQDQDKTWQQRMDQQYRGKGRRAGSELPKGTFTESPSEIARQLKQHSEDRGEASSKLNGFINRKGRNLQGADKSRLYDAKKALDDAYGVRDGKTPEEQNKDANKTETAADANWSLFTNSTEIPQDQPALDSGLGAAARLVATAQ
ncbi:hypothetical protein BcepSauron_276 [Burkholderia phage BcepSauron]|uniref:Uncharacterized protein n=2 Tax=Sarumanvirus TaxID=2843450 RepID=A0A482MMA9_9CAUD|nr:hypothetical protein H1O16_gp275 [Burkholderia phage BcepSaruman]YP_009904654.1 hypothetical protein H1O17_gp276 [Burkholderia phage BcepSauron]QBQ74656.1 hypothetical protein BcepSauron_276 [Burkholderia phage BcepSauron]QBX06688.1 hypothetical protein BcepSaruman_275 [Burkholderia phage BcepSaruman]